MEGYEDLLVKKTNKQTKQKTKERKKKQTTKTKATKDLKPQGTEQCDSVAFFLPLKT